MEEKVKEMVEMKQRSLAEDNQKTLEALKERYFIIMTLIKHFKWLADTPTNICITTWGTKEISSMAPFILHVLIWSFDGFYRKNESALIWNATLLTLFELLNICREFSLQDQLRQATESVKNMQKLHEFAQSQLLELRTQSGSLSLSPSLPASLPLSLPLPLVSSLSIDMFNS